MKNKYISQTYLHPKWYWFLPLAGFFIYLYDAISHKNEYIKDKVQYKKLKELETKLFIYLNIFIILLFIINIFITNVGFFIWKKLVQKAGWIL